MPTLVRAIRRVHCRGIEFEVVSARDSRAIAARRGRSRRPIIAVDASVPESSATNTGQVYDPAAHEVKRSSCNVVVYAIGRSSNKTCQPILTQHILETT